MNSSINIRLRINFSTQFLFFLVLVFCWVFHEAAEPIIILGYFGYSAFLQIIYKSPCMSEQRTRLSGDTLRRLKSAEIRKHETKGPKVEQNGTLI